MLHSKISRPNRLLEATLLAEIADDSCPVHQIEQMTHKLYYIEAMLHVFRRVIPVGGLVALLSH